MVAGPGLRQDQSYVDQDSGFLLQVIKWQGKYGPNNLELVQVSSLSKRGLFVVLQRLEAG